MLRLIPIAKKASSQSLLIARISSFSTKLSSKSSQNSRQMFEYELPSDTNMKLSPVDQRVQDPRNFMGQSEAPKTPQFAHKSNHSIYEQKVSEEFQSGLKKQGPAFDNRGRDYEGLNVPNTDAFDPREVKQVSSTK